MKDLCNKYDTDDDFEYLLQQERYNETTSSIDKKTGLEILHPQKSRQPGYSKASKSADYEDFIEMVNKIVTTTLKNEGVDFLPDDNRRQSIEHPTIFYSVASRIPRENEPKPKYREDFIEKDENNNPVKRGVIYGQVFDYLVQFDILASDYTTANRVMNKFEDAMFKYLAYFKKNGVSELFFKRQLADNNQNVYKERVSVRTLEYLVSLEKIRIMYDSVIADISERNV